MRTTAVPSNSTQNGASQPANEERSIGRCPVDHEALARLGISAEDVMANPQKYAHLMNGAASSNGSAQTNCTTSHRKDDESANSSMESGRCPVDHEALSRLGVSFEDVMKDPQKYAHLMNGAASSSSLQANGSTISSAVPDQSTGTC